MLDLYVWGQAFDLPSIDAECLAAITYLYHAASDTAWRLVPCNDPSVSPARLLPALLHDGVWTSGFRQIVAYLMSNSLCQNLDESLDSVQRADCTAYSAYLYSHAAPLVDLSLFVSAANWAATTRPAYTALLPFPLTWTLPPLLRSQAIQRSQHLGLAELDTDFDPSSIHLSGQSLPETFLRHLPHSSARSVRGGMTPEQTAAIRLVGLAKDCLTTLDALIQAPSDEKNPRSFATTPLSSLDCLAYGHLALMLNPPVPRSFLKDCIEGEAPRLANFVNSLTLTAQDLPWANPEPTTVLKFGARLLDSLIRNAPGIGDHYANQTRHRAEVGAAQDSEPSGTMHVSGLLATAAAAGYAFYAYRTIQPFGASTQVWRGRQTDSLLTQLGSIFNSSFGSHVAASRTPLTEATGHGRLVETDSELD